MACDSTEKYSVLSQATRQVAVWLETVQKILPARQSLIQNSMKIREIKQLPCTLRQIEIDLNPSLGPLFKSLNGAAYGRFIKQLVISGVLKIKNVCKYILIIVKNQ